jgi:hypothetical protein
MGKGTLHLRNGCKIEGVFKGQSIENLTLKSNYCKYMGKFTVTKATLSRANFKARALWR